jgi:hypothetical protein
MNPWSVSDEKGTRWLNECVALMPDGSRVIGDYDGYGKVGDFELDWDAAYDGKQAFELVHQKCWEASGRRDFEEQSPDARGQGHFYDDADVPPDKDWRRAMAEGKDVGEVLGQVVDMRAKHEKERM